MRELEMNESGPIEIILKKDQRSSNKFRGSENAVLKKKNFHGRTRRGSRNLNGLDPVAELKNAAQRQIDRTMAAIAK